MFSIAADERAALQCEDLASALDAGLPLASLGGDPAQGDRVLHGILQRRGVVLSAVEAQALEAAWRAGRAPTALRSRAEQRRGRAGFRRSVVRALRYPLLVLSLVVLAGFTTAPVVGHYWFAIGVTLLVAALAAGAFAVRRGLAGDSERWVALPFVGPIAKALGELPYLETLHALYASGVPLAQAHPTAVASAGVGSVRRRLQVADRVLQGGSPLAEALAQAAALHPETRTLLANGEAAGQLEDALHRALERRRDVAGRSLEQSARVLGGTAYAIGVVSVLWLVWSFYSNLFRHAGLRG